VSAHALQHKRREQIDPGLGFLRIPDRPGAEGLATAGVFYTVIIPISIHSNPLFLDFFLCNTLTLTLSFGGFGILGHLGSEGDGSITPIPQRKPLPEQKKIRRRSSDELLI
jgi:hypothetical protein